MPLETWITKEVRLSVIHEMDAANVLTAERHVAHAVIWAWLGQIFRWTNNKKWQDESGCLCWLARGSELCGWHVGNSE